MFMNRSNSYGEGCIRKFGLSSSVSITERSKTVLLSRVLLLLSLIVQCVHGSVGGGGGGGEEVTPYIRCSTDVRPE